MKVKSLKLPLLLAVIIFVAIFLGPIMSVKAQKFFYSISLTINSLLIFLMPFLIFCLLFSSLMRMSGYFLRLVLLLFPAICLSNFAATMLAYVSGGMIIRQFNLIKLPAMQQGLTPLWKLNLIKLVGNQSAMLAAIILACVCILINKNIASRKGENFIEFLVGLLSNTATMILQKIIVPILPLFIFGFLIKLQYDGMLTVIIKNYGFVFAAIFATQITYLLLLYGIAANFNLHNWWRSIKNMLPAWGVGFTTMSSAAAMPLTLDGASKNTKDAQVAKLVIPSTVNVHLIGDCIAISILALTILISFGNSFPELSLYFLFAVYFVIAKFAVAAVPAGGIIVMVPILEQYLGFNSEMSSLITALYVLFDPIITSSNILGNGAFVMLFNKLVAKIK